MGAAVKLNGKGAGRAKAKMKVHDLALSQITDDPTLQPREQMDLDIMREYSMAWLEGAEFPPVDVYYDGETYWLADGFYRVRSARKANLTSIKANVWDGGKREALLHSVGANSTHGIRRSSQDKKKAIVTVLDDPEWCLWSDEEIAKACRVSKSMVSQYRKGSPGLKGHNVTVRLNAEGDLRSTPSREVAPLPEGVDNRTFRRPPILMSRSEIVEKFQTRLFRHIKKSNPDARQDAPYKFGTIEIATATTLYAISLITERHSLYSVVGRMLVAREALNSKANIVIIGHFPRSVADVVQILGDNLGIECQTPEQILTS